MEIIFYIYHFWQMFDELVIKGLVIAILILITSKIIFKKLDIYIALKIIKVILLLLCVFSVSFLINYFLQENIQGIPLISNIEYNPAYQAIQWMSICFRILLPLTLLIKKIRNNLLYLLLVSILINLYWIFDLMIIELIQPENLRFFPHHNPKLYLVSGVIFGILLTITSLIYSKYKLTKSK